MGFPRPARGCDPRGETRIGNYWFASSGIESVEIAASVAEIGEEAFFLCERLKYVAFPEKSKLERIGRSAFERSGVEEIAVHSGMRAIGARAFYKCIRLRKLSVQNKSGLRVIGELCFFGTQLRKAQIPVVRGK